MVIAAGLTLARQKGEFSQVLLKPKNLEEFRPKSFKPYYQDGGEADDDFWNEDESQKKQVPVPEADAWNDTAEPKKKKKKGGKGGGNDLFAKYQQQAAEARKMMVGSDDEDGTAPKQQPENQAEAATLESS